jgi:hypothetical protein
MNRIQSIIIGSILGDGCLEKTKTENRNSRLTLGHSEKQKEYLEWKVNILKEFGLSTGSITKCVAKSNRYKSGQCISYHTKSRKHSVFTKYRKLFYLNGKKTLDFSNLHITPMALAIWYMDDGQKCSASYQINTQCFNRDTLVELAKYLEKAYGLEFTIDKTNVMYLRKASISKFESLIKPYIIDCMKYKLR